MKYQKRAMLRDIAHSLTSAASLNMSSNESAVLHLNNAQGHLETPENPVLEQ
jgi:hypothetical protein